MAGSAVLEDFTFPNQTVANYFDGNSLVVKDTWRSGIRSAGSRKTTDPVESVRSTARAARGWCSARTTRWDGGDGGAGVRPVGTGSFLYTPEAFPTTNGAVTGARWEGRTGRRRGRTQHQPKATGSVLVCGARSQPIAVTKRRLVVSSEGDNDRPLSAVVGIALRLIRAMSSKKDRRDSDDNTI